MNSRHQHNLPPQFESTFEDIEIKFIEDFADLLRSNATEPHLSPKQIEIHNLQDISKNYSIATHLYGGKYKSNLRDTNPLELVYLAMAMGAPTPRHPTTSYHKPIYGTFDIYGKLGKNPLIPEDDFINLSMLEATGSTLRGDLLSAELLSIEGQDSGVIPRRENDEAYRLALRALHVGKASVASHSHSDFAIVRDRLLVAMDQTDLAPSVQYGAVPWLKVRASDHD